MAIDQISVFVENNPGRLAELAEILSAAEIDMSAMCIAETADFGILRAIVNDPAQAVRILRQRDYIVSVTQVLAVRMEDTPGSLAKILCVLADENISVEYTYAFTARKRDMAYVIFRVEDNARAEAIFTAHGIETAEADEVCAHPPHVHTGHLSSRKVMHKPAPHTSS